MTAYYLAMIIETAIIRSHEVVSQTCRLLKLESPRIAELTKPGQFVHMRVPNLSSAVLRRPFSLFKAYGSHIEIMYKIIGSGTRAMTLMKTGDEISLMGPLGNSFPVVSKNCFPVLVGGGYGIAALRLLAERSIIKGIVFIGAACDKDVLCSNEFRQLDWETRIVTEDGSEGEHGRVDKAIDLWLANDLNGRTPEFFGCGPMGMLKAIADRAISDGRHAWLSLEQHMGCGVGVCLGCAQKAKIKRCKEQNKTDKQHDDKTWKWIRVCSDGPVFECRDILWDDHK